MPSISPENNKKCDDGPDYKQQAKTLIITGVTPRNSSSPVDRNSGGDQHNENHPCEPPVEEDGPDFKQQAKSIVVAGQRSAKVNARSCSNRLGKADAPKSNEVGQEASDSPEVLWNNNSNNRLQTKNNTINSFPVTEGENVPIVEARLVGIEELGEQTRAQIYMQPTQPQNIGTEGRRINHNIPYPNNNQQDEPQLQSTTTSVESSPPDSHNKSKFSVITKKRLIWTIVIIAFITIVAAIGGICADGSCARSSNDVVVDTSSANENTSLRPTNSPTRIFTDGFDDATIITNSSSSLTQTPTTRTTLLRPSNHPTGKFTDESDYNKCQDCLNSSVDVSDNKACLKDCSLLLRDNDGIKPISHIDGEGIR